MRERKSMSTKRKKEAYWEYGLKQLVHLMLVVYKTQLGGKVEVDVEITTQFSDSFTNDLSETSSALSQLEAARAISTVTKVRMLHPDWSEAEVLAEADLIIQEHSIGAMMNPDDVNPDSPGGFEEGGDKDGDQS